MFAMYMWIITSFCVLTTAWGSDRIKLKDISSLTLYHGKMTTARRGYPVPQLKCVGGTAGCAFVPKVVQCRNMGSDGYTVQWKCETDMDNEYCFGNVEVTCEGYDHPDDSYAFKGSCGLEYTIDLTKEGHGRGQSQSKHDYYTSPNVFSKKSSGLGDVIILVMVGLVIYALYKTCLGPQIMSGEGSGDTGPGGPRRGGWFGSWFGGNGRGGYGYPPSAPPPPGFRPEYSDSGNLGCGNAGGTGAGVGGGGFWTGAMTGGLLGYVFGNRRANDGAYGTTAPPTSGGWYGGRSSYSSYTPASSRNSQSTGSRTASGFGGTKTR